MAVVGRLVVAVLRRLPFRALGWLERRGGTLSFWSSIVATAFVLRDADESRRRRSAGRHPVAVEGVD